MAIAKVAACSWEDKQVTGLNDMLIGRNGCLFNFSIVDPNP